MGLVGQSSDLCVGQGLCLGGRGSHPPRFLTVPQFLSLLPAAEVSSPPPGAAAPRRDPRPPHGGETHGGETPSPRPRPTRSLDPTERPPRDPHTTEPPPLLSPLPSWNSSPTSDSGGPPCAPQPPRGGARGLQRRRRRRRSSSSSPGSLRCSNPPFFGSYLIYFHLPQSPTRPLPHPPSNPFPRPPLPPRLFAGKSRPSPLPPPLPHPLFSFLTFFWTE